MTSPLSPTETEPQHAYRELWGRSQRWFDQLEHSPRTLWTARDLLGEGGAANRGACAHLGIYFKACGFSHRTVRGLFDVRTGKLQPQCTLWRTKPGALPSLLRTEHGWRMRYHYELIKFRRVTDRKLLSRIQDSMDRDARRDNPDCDLSEQRSFIESLFLRAQNRL